MKFCRRTGRKSCRRTKEDRCANAQTIAAGLLVLLVAIVFAACASDPAPTPTTRERDPRLNPRKEPNIEARAVIADPTEFDGPAELSYPDESGYLERIDDLMSVAVHNYVSAQREVRWAVSGYESGSLGSPHQYALPAIYGRLLIEPDEQMWWDGWMDLPDNVYHFRLTHEVPLFFHFEDRVPDDLRAQLVEHWRAFDIWTGGTENHMTQERYNGYLLYERVPELADEETLDRLREWIHEQTQLLFTYGQGEYDSSTYIVYTLAGLMALEQYALDEDVVAMARAALDWFAVTAGMKYFHTVYSGPESRGFSSAPGVGDTTPTLWTWFGDAHWRVSELDPDARSIRASFPPALSTYRPNRIIYNIATNNVDLPYSWRGSKPQYYHEYHNYAREVGYMDDAFTMSTLYHPYNDFQRTGTIFGQTTPFKLVVRDRGAAAVFGVGHEYMPYHATQGRDPYGQYHQHDGTMVFIAHVPDDESDGVGDDDALRIVHRSLFAAPRSLGDPVERDGYLFYEADGAYVAVLPVTGEYESLGEVEGRRGGGTHNHFASNGRTTGWIVEAVSASDYADFDAFQTTVLNEPEIIGAGTLDEQRGYSYRSLSGDELSIEWNEDDSRPIAATNGETLEYDDWPVYESPYLSIPIESGVLEATDGEWRMRIDYSGAVPEWSYERIEQSDEH